MVGGACNNPTHARRVGILYIPQSAPVIFQGFACVAVEVLLLLLRACCCPHDGVSLSQPAELPCSCGGCRENQGCIEGCILFCCSGGLRGLIRCPTHSRHTCAHVQSGACGPAVVATAHAAADGVVLVPPLLSAFCKGMLCSVLHGQKSRGQSGRQAGTQQSP